MPSMKRGLRELLDEERAEWELSHDFVAHAVGRFGRRRGQIFRQVAAYAAPTLLVVSLIAGFPSLQGLAQWFVTVKPYMRDHISAFRPYPRCRACA